MYDILIQNGTVVDGTGSPGYLSDLAIKKGRIAAVGGLAESSAATKIDAAGRVVCPGFIDMHSHADFSLPSNRTANSLVHQGITTAVVGQCGLSPAPLLPETRDEVITALGGFFGDMVKSMPWDQWASMADYLSYLAEPGISLNVVPLVGQGLIRAGVMGFAESKASSDQLSKMRRIAANAMDDGAFGISTGLIYPPGSFTTTDELIDIARVVGKKNGVYFSHIRGEADTLLEAVSEAIEIGRQSGTAVQISHFKAASKHNWGKSRRALELIHQAQTEGLDVTSDLYPYLAGSTSLATMLPQWAHVGGPEATLERLSNPQDRAKMKSDMQTSGFAKGFEWSQVLITSAPGQASCEGRYISDLASEEAKDPYEWVFDALEQTALDMGMAIFGMSEENRRSELAFPTMMIGTDGLGFAESGPMAKGVPHPRSYGAFPRVLGRYVRELGILSLEEAIHRMTGLPAKKLRLDDRGRVAADMAADLVIFDPSSIIDKADFEHPHQYAGGISHVLVNGDFAIRDERHSGDLPGKVLSRR